MSGNQLVCDDRLQWIHKGREQGWLDWSGRENCTSMPVSGNDLFIICISMSFNNVF